MSYGASGDYGLGRYHAAENDWKLIPRGGPERTGRAVMFCHGGGGVAADACNPTKTGTYPLVQALGRQFPIISGDWGGTLTWGNATSTSRVEEGRTHMGTATGATVSKVNLLGISMGAFTCFQYAKANPTLVQSIAIIIGAVDLDYIYQNDISSSRAGIGTAWGVTFPTALPAGAILLTDTTSWDAIPIKAWYVTDDIFTPTASLTTFIGNCALGSAVSLGALGHGEAAVAAVPSADLISFYTAAG